MPIHLPLKQACSRKNCIQDSAKYVIVMMYFLQDTPRHLYQISLWNLPITIMLLALNILECNNTINIRILTTYPLLMIFKKILPTRHIHIFYQTTPFFIGIITQKLVVTMSDPPKVIMLRALYLYKSFSYGVVPSRRAAPMQVPNMNSERVESKASMSSITAIIRSDKLSISSKQFSLIA